MNRTSASSSRHDAARNKEKTNSLGRVREKPIFKAQKQHTSFHVNGEAVARHRKMKNENPAAVELDDEVEVNNDGASLYEVTPQAVCTVPSAKTAESSDKTLLLHVKDIKIRQLEMQQEMKQLRDSQQEILFTQGAWMREFQNHILRLDHRLEAQSKRNDEVVARLANISRQQDKARDSIASLVNGASETRIAIERLPTLEQISRVLHQAREDTTWNESVIAKRPARSIMSRRSLID